jgi:AcrR family transcriptional regulator
MYHETIVTSYVSSVNIVVSVNIRALVNLTTVRTKPYHHGDLRRTLIVAGIELLGEGGAAALDLRNLARKAGVSHAAPYRHFEDKRALLAAIAEEGFIRLTDRLKEALSVATSDSPLLALTRAYVNFALSEPALMREMFSGLTIDRMEYPSLHAAGKEALAVVVQAVEQAQKSGAFVKGDPEQLALVMWSMFHGLAMLLLENQMPMITSKPNGVDEMIERCITSLYNGLQPR